jgi:hypothetical protein
MGDLLLRPPVVRLIRTFFFSPLVGAGAMVELGSDELRVRSSVGSSLAAAGTA